MYETDGKKYIIRQKYNYFRYLFGRASNLVFIFADSSYSPYNIFIYYFYLFLFFLYFSFSQFIRGRKIKKNWVSCTIKEIRVFYNLVNKPTQHFLEYKLNILWIIGCFTAKHIQNRVLRNPGNLWSSPDTLEPDGRELLVLMV